MSNPPEGWYPDPTGQPNTIRWWNGTQWTNKTEKETLEEPSDPTPSGKADAAAVSAAEKAKSTWMETPAQNVASGHWTQQPRPEPEPESQPESAATATPPEDEPEQKAWTLTLATDPTSTPTADPAPDGGDTAAGDSPEQTKPPAQSWGQDATQSWTTTPTWDKQEPESSPNAEGQSTGEQQSGAGQWQPAGQGTAAGPQQSAASGQPDGEQQNGVGQSQATVGAQTGYGPWQAAAGQQAGVGQWTVPGSQQSEAAEQQAVPDQWEAGGAQGGVRQGGGGGQQGATLGGGGDGPGGRPSKVVVIVSSVVGLVLIIIAAAFFVTNRSDDDTADPSTSPSTQPTDQPTGSSSPTSSTSPPPTTPSGQSTIPPGQSKDPKLHEGARISSAAISYPRQKPPWSDRKRLVPQLENSSGQYVLLQEKFDGKNDWYADMFVGSLGTSAGFNGNPQATASDLAYQLRSTMYGDIPVIIKPLRNGAVQRSGKSGWYYQQSVTASSTKVTARVLTLTVAVFNLGDGTAVAYISDIPTNRPDLRTVESQVYKGINVG